VLLTRGPDATLLRGSTVEMVLDRALTFSAADLDFSNAPRADHSRRAPRRNRRKNNNLSPHYPF